MSLLTEIVTRKSNSKLFSVPQAYDTDEAGGLLGLRNSTSKEEKVPSHKNLSSVDEDHSDIDSQTYPQIRILKSNDGPDVE